ncbi:alpha/beta hydrolase [Rhodobacteraceae bacterium KMM 6894]|nr:alpha/beta hydrolase [Rhodobacteraceae bacterium KMM 6894]
MMWVKRGARALVLILVLSAGGWLGLGALETRAIYPFDTTRVLPSAVGVTAREAVHQTSGATMILWVAQPKPGAPVILYLHGNAGNLAARAGRFQQFIARGYGVIAPAYRGSSGSTGTPSETAITGDMISLYKALGDYIPGMNPNAVVIYGESLGTGVALKLVASGAKPAAVVLEAPFTSLPDVVRASVPRMTPLIPRMTSIWDSVHHARTLRAPLLVLHGTRDGLIPIEQGRAIVDAARSGIKEMIEVPGADHHDIWRGDILPRLWRFIEAHGRR